MDSPVHSLPSQTPSGRNGRSGDHSILELSRGGEESRGLYQNQAFSALLFLYQEVLGRKLSFIDDVQRVKRPAKVPVVFTPEEARAVLDQLHGEYRLMAELLYGSGLRLMECLRLRVKDIDFGYGQITVRDGKGLRERVTLLAESVRRPLQLHLEQVQQIHQRDLAANHGRVYLPFAIERKFPNAARSWTWQYVFPASKLSIDPRSGASPPPRFGKESSERC